MFLHKLVDVVRSHSMRLRRQYSGERAAEDALEEVDSQLEGVERKLHAQQSASPTSALAGGSPSKAQADSSSNEAYAEALVTVLEQVAALRSIGSQAHPALQQMVLTHDAHLQQLLEAAGAGGGGDKALQERLVQLEAQVQGVAADSVKLGKALEQVLAVGAGAGTGGDEGAADGSGVCVSALALKVALLEEGLQQAKIMSMTPLGKGTR